MKRKQILTEEEFNILLGIAKPVFVKKMMIANVKNGGVFVLNNIEVHYEDNNFVAYVEEK